MADETKPPGRVWVGMWLPVGRPNFFSPTADSELLHLGADDGKACSAPFDADQVAIQCSVMRRILEVLPRSFGYEAEATWEAAANDQIEHHPGSITLTLRPRVSADEPTTEGRANAELIRARVTEVSCTVTERGFYTWSACLDGTAGLDAVGEALRHHASEVVGGDFSLHRDAPEHNRDGSAAMIEYNSRPPIGTLTFFQLNLLVEGLLNETLYPAVFFENDALLRAWADDLPTGRRPFADVGSFVELICRTSASDPTEADILNHFLTTTSREVLQRLKWSLESVRRGLLDEMLSVIHRQSRLSQLDLASVERTPDQAIGGNEGQLRGFADLSCSLLPRCRCL